MISHHQVADCTNVVWATPTSGFGHLSDEQPLPYIHHQGVAITPMVGGDASLPDCGPATLGLPFGLLSQQWPVAQRLFNLTRRPINLYWRNVFKSRCSSDQLFYLHQQLHFTATPSGFRGACPLMQFERSFAVTAGRVHVTDILLFRKTLKFERFALVVLPLFSEWRINGKTLPVLETTGFELQPSGLQRSAAGTATLWLEQMSQKTFVAGDLLQREYSYRWLSA